MLFANKSNLNRHIQRAHFKQPRAAEDVVHEDDDREEADDESSQSTTASMEAPEMETEQEIDWVKTKGDDEHDAEDEVDVWAELIEIANRSHNGDIYEAVRSQMLFSRALRHDSTISEITRTIKNVQFEEDMDFDEALSYAVNKRMFLIKRRVEEEQKTDSQQ